MAAACASAVPQAPAPIDRDALKPHRGSAPYRRCRAASAPSRRNVERVGRAPSASRSAPAHATIAPLSVQSGIGGTTSVRAGALSAASRSGPRRSPCWPQPRPPPPARGSLPGQLRPRISASAELRARRDDLRHGALEAGADVRDRPGRSSGACCSAGEPHGRLQAREREIEPLFLEQRLGEVEATPDRLGRASFSTSGPPGLPSPSSLATLSKASPSASSIVVPQRS
jgi:hypothetical protein